MNENSSITTQRAAEMLGVSVSSIYRMEKMIFFIQSERREAKTL